MSYFGRNSTRRKTYAGAPVENNRINRDSKDAYIRVQSLEYENARLKKEVMKLEVQLQTSKWVQSSVDLMI